ncbi:MAG: ABC transporter permease [Proteobacteria bacterium]|nr:ABC transporter permease [Pseudomonadota bacterium]
MTSFWRREQTAFAVVAIGIGSSLFLIAVWGWLTREDGPISALLLPSPEAFMDAFWRLLRRPYLGSSFYVHILSSLSVVLGGWLLAAVVGVPLGIAMAWWQRLRWTVFPVFQLVRPVPPLAWIPLAIIWLGIGISARMSVVFVAALVPWVLNSMQAVVSVDPILVQAARTLGASNRAILTRVVARTALPTLIAGARIALGNAWTTVIAAELLAASSGLGYVALNASRTLDTDILLVAMATIGVLGALLSFAMQALARALAPWSRGEGA